jgi:TatD DNase family protein
MLWDSHAHVAAPDLFPDAAAVLERARAAGVEGVISVGAGYGLAHNAYAVALADEHADVWATAGLHPHDASEWGEHAGRAIAGWLEHPRVVAAGECGLDYWYERSPRDAQREALRAQIRLARAHAKPLVIHARASRGSSDAFFELVRIFDEEGAERAGGVIHCFTGDLPFARECLARGFAISFSGILTFPNAADLRAVAKALPRDSLLVETDSPLLAPVPHRGKRNEPAWVACVAECLAGVHGVPFESIAKSTAERTRAVFRIGAGA